MHQRILTLLLALGAITSLPAAVFELAPVLPPECPSCQYAAESDIVFGPGLATLSSLRFGDFSSIVRTPVGPNDELETYNATGAGVLQLGSSFFDVFFDVTVDSITHGNRPIPIGSFATEMLQMNLTGSNFPVLVRESPTLPSFGQSTVQPVPGGFRVDSFFDVFTELSLDGGQNWIPSNGPPTRLSINDTPEPSTIGLGLLGLLGCGWRVLRRRRSTVAP